MSGPPREFEVELPIGVNDGAGRFQREAVLRKMRGHEEALLYDPDLDASELASLLIAGTLLRLGDLESPGADMVTGMYSADRNFLLLQLRRITLGDHLAAGYRCPSCGEEVTVTEDLRELPIRALEEGEDPEAIEVTLEDGYEDKEGTVHRTLTLRLPRGADESFVAPMMGRDPMKASDALVLRCIRRFGTIAKAELEAYGVRILRDLTLGDRLTIQRALTDEVPGARLRRDIRCSACGIRFEHALDVSDFFVPC